jgi:hypothetical protein
MPITEKGRSAGSDPIPNYVRQDKPESTSQLLNLQVRRLSRLYALSFETAATLAPFVFAGLPR